MSAAASTTTCTTDEKQRPSDDNVDNESELTVIDTHAHLEYILTQRGNTLPIEAFLPDSLHSVVCVFCDAAAVSSFGIYQELLLHPKIYGAFGCHPRNAASWTSQFHERVVNALQHEKARAWGECGLDFVVASNRDVQIACFREQALRAVELGFPLVVHSRGAPDETFQVLTECCPPTHKIHVHCFAGDVAEAERLFAHFSNLWIGYTGSITHHNAHGERIRQVVVAVPLERVLLETDAPYMALDESTEEEAAANNNNKKKKGKQRRHPPSTPADVLGVARFVAQLKQLPLAEVLKQANKNAREMYNLP